MCLEWASPTWEPEPSTCCSRCAPWRTIWGFVSRWPPLVTSRSQLCTAIGSDSVGANVGGFCILARCREPLNGAGSSAGAKAAAMGAGVGVLVWAGSNWSRVPPSADPFTECAFRPGDRYNRELFSAGADGDRHATGSSAGHVKRELSSAGLRDVIATDTSAEVTRHDSAIAEPENDESDFLEHTDEAASSSTLEKSTSARRCSGLFGSTDSIE